MMIFCHSVVHGVRRQNRQPLVIPCLSEVVLAQGPRPQYYKPAPQTAALERQGVASSSHSRYSTTTIFLSNFSKKACTMLGDEELCMVRPTLGEGIPLPIFQFWCGELIPLPPRSLTLRDISIKNSLLRLANFPSCKMAPFCAILIFSYPPFRLV